MRITGNGLRITGNGIRLGGQTSSPPPTYSFSATSGNYIGQYTSNGDGTGSFEFYCANASDQTVDPVNGYGYMTYFQTWIRQEPGGPNTLGPFTVFDATTNASYTITPQTAASTFSGGIQYTIAICNSTAPNLTNITLITQA